MGTRDERVDGYIARAALFAQPILQQIREIVHAACPEVDETIKWGVPHFTLQGNLCMMAAHKTHATLIFWLGEQVLGDPQRASGHDQFGKLTSVDQLPPRETLLRYVQQAAALDQAGVKQERLGSRIGTKRPEAEVPAELAAALAQHPAAQQAFAAFAPSHRREYCRWIAEARKPETREKRALQAVEMLAEGKPRNWQYR